MKPKALEDALKEGYEYVLYIVHMYMYTASLLNSRVCVPL